MLRRQTEKVLLNILTATSARASGTQLFIEGYGGILDNTSMILQATRTCTTPCTKQETDITVVIPTSCECPYEWGLTIKTFPRPLSYEVQQTFGKSIFYGYSDPAGGTPTAAATATAIIANINADPFSPVVASSGGAGVITLVEKNCDYINGTNGFGAYTDSGTVTPVTAHVEEVLGAGQMSKLFPILPGQFGANPTRPDGGTYCKMTFVLRGDRNIQDIDMSSTYAAYEQDVDIYVNNRDTDWPAFLATVQSIFPTI